VVAVSRRTVLAAGGAGVLLAACTDGGPAAPVVTIPPAPDPLLAELADEHRLVATYDATLLRYPALRARLAGPRADHAAHVEALSRLLGPAAPGPGAAPGSGTPDATGSGTTGATGSGTPDATASGTPGAGAAAVPATAAAALVALRAAERAAASARGTAALTAAADRARLLAGISASEACHLVVLA
jgi:hypothetical protein